MENLPGDYAKFVGMTDDLRAIADYINDLRLIFFIVTATGYACGIIFLLIKLFQLCCKGSHGKKKKKERIRTNSVEDPNLAEVFYIPYHGIDSPRYSTVPTKLKRSVTDRTRPVPVADVKVVNEDGLRSESSA